MAGLCLAAAPASASMPIEDTTQAASDAATEARRGTDAAREEAAQHVPTTGTEIDPAVHDALTPQGDPQVEEKTVSDLVHTAVVTAVDALQTVRALVPDEDPLQLVGRRVDPIAGAATGMLPAADAYEVEQPAPASGGATAVKPDVSPQLLVAGASAAAAVAIVALWLAASSGSLGAAGAGGAGGASGGSELRRLLPFASPLFTRFQKDTVLGHPKREALYALILQDPGVSLQSLCDSTGLSRTAVTHHLRLIELQHLIVSKRMGRSRHYYENGGRFGRDQKEAYAVLHNGRTKDVARFVRDNPGAIQKSLCDKLGIQPSIAHWHLRRLQEAQLVQAVRQGRTVSYFPGPALRSLDNPVVPASVAEEPVAVATPPMPMLRAMPA